MSVSLESYHLHNNSSTSSPQPTTTATTSPKLLVVLTHKSNSNLSFSDNDVIENNRVIISSLLYKRSTHRKHWKKQWITLRRCQLSRYKDSREHKPLKVYNTSKLLSFNIIPDHHKNHFAIYTPNKVLHFKTDDHELFNQWIDALHEFFKLKDQEYSKEGNNDDFNNINGNNNDADEEEDEDFEDTEDAEELDQVNSGEPLVNDGDTTENDISQNSKSGGSLTSLTYQPPTLPIHSINNRQMQVKRSLSNISDSVNTETSDDLYSSDGFTSDTPSTPNIQSNTMSSSYFNTLDVPREEDERDKTPVKSRPRNESQESILQEIPEYIIEKGSLEVLRKKYNHQWKKYDVTLTNKTLRLDISHGNTFSFPVCDIQDVIELDPISSKRKWCLMIITPLKRLRFSCNNEIDMTNWFSALKAAIVSNKNQ